MTTVAADTGDSPEPQPSYSLYLLLHHTLKLLGAEGCKGVDVTSDNVGPLVKAAKDMLSAFGIQPGLGGLVTRPLPQVSTLSGDQRRAVERARDFLRAAAAGPHTLAACLDAGAVEDTALFYATDGFGAAQKLLLDLLAILDELATTSRAGGAR
jgi:hypothetical protein